MNTREGYNVFITHTNAWEVPVATRTITIRFVYIQNTISALTDIVDGLFFTNAVALLKKRKEGRKCFIQRRTQHILFTVVWRRKYGKEPLR